jgi:uncharacterized repeat protein (TIGR01451 family)
MGVVIRDPLPAAILPPHGGYTFTVSPGSGFMCSIDTSNVLTCTGGMVAAQSTATITVNLIAPETTGTYTSVVQVDPNNTIPESDKQNNSATATTTVVPGADLTVSQKVDHNPVAPAGTLDYTITVPNQGTQDVTGVEVVDTLPAGTTFRSAADTSGHNFTCSFESPKVRCVGGIIKGTYTAFPSIDKATIVVMVFAPNVPGVPPGTITNQVRVDPNNLIGETDKTNNISYETTEVALGGGGQYIELHPEELTSSPEPVAPNGELTYKMKIANSGTEEAFNVQVNDTLPAGARYRNATGTGGFECSNAASVVVCTGGSVPAGGFDTITITAFAPPQPNLEKEHYTDQVTVDPNNEIPEADETNNTATVPTTVALGGGGVYIDLAATTIATVNGNESPPETVEPLGLITYTVTVKNNGSAPAFNVETDDSLPANATFVSATTSAPSKTINSGTCELASDGRTVKCVGATVSPKSPITIKIVAQAPNTSTELEEKSTNVVSLVTVGPDAAIVNPTNAIPDGEPNNDSAPPTKPIEVLSKLDLSITQNGPGTASQNGTPTYTLTVTNNGTIPAVGVQVHDPLPVGLIVQNISVSPTTFACQASENPVNVIDCLGEIPASESVTITVNTFVTASDGTTLTNQACVNPNRTLVEYIYLNNCSTKAITVSGKPPPPMPDLSVSQADSVSPVSPGQSEVYTIDVQNIATTKSAETEAPNSTMKDTLPTGLKFVSATGTNGATCKNAGQEVECELHTLKAGDSTLITLTVTVTPSASGPIINESTVSTSAEEVTLSNNSATTTVNLNGTGVDLAATSMKTDHDPVQPGHVLTYTSVIKNQGVQEPPKPFLIRQFLPPKSQVKFISAAGSGGFNCVLSGENVDCTGNLPAGSSTTITVKVQVEVAAPAALKSTITADPENEVAETDKTNNSKSVTTTVSNTTCTECFDLVMGTLVSSPETVKTEDQLTYNFTVGNAGDETAPFPISSSATGVVIVDFLDPNVTFDKASASNGFTATYDSLFNAVIFVQGPNCKFNTVSHEVECEKGKPSTLAPGAGVIVSITTKVKAVAPPFTIGNEATVFALPGEFNEFNNTASTSTEVKEVGPLLRGARLRASQPITSTGASAAGAGVHAPTGAQCRLPNLLHMTRGQVRRALGKALCGKVAVRFRGRGLKVVKQTLRPGTAIHKRTALTLSLGRA